ncbi:unnamed protein product [Adineta steineri]|uniref:F-box domain-containing protein n=2 Tax=Adineta steineri TaxID=433720 RepID=A0A815N1S4_9BILA|nr:unnamed protein product [Adineta steineri]
MVNNMKLEDISNELFLCIWDQLSMADAIYSFSNLNTRIDRMLLKFCGLYNKLDLRYCSLSIFRYFSHQIIMKDEWRLNLTVLKIGNSYRCSIQFNTDLEENQTSKHLSQKLETLWFGMDRLLLSFDKNQILSSVFIQALRCPSSQGKTLVLSQKRGIMSENIVKQIQLTHFNMLVLVDSIDTNINYNLQELTCWFQLLPNIICLEICLTEFKYWLTNDTNNLYLCSVLQRLERLHVDCSSLINKQMNEEIYHLFLSYIIDKDRFPQLKCLRLRSCKNIASSWENIDQWISFILTHINEHQLTCVRFDFIEQEKKTTEMNIYNQIMRIVQLSSIIDIHQFVHDNHIALWIERRYKYFSLTK